jgi:hypothetical protein
MLQAQLQQFARYVRNPQMNLPPPDIEVRRLKIYKDLFFNNIQALLSGMFPVVRSLYTTDAWLLLVREFYQYHHCETPYFPSIAQEFIAWLRDEKLLPENKPFLLELAHYEWVELALATSDELISLPHVNTSGDLMAGVPVVSPVCWPLSYVFPVHRIGAGFQPITVPEDATYLIVYRNADDKICFVESNAASVRLLELLQNNYQQAHTAYEPSSMAPLTGEQVLSVLAQELQQVAPHAVLQFGEELLNTWYRLGIIIGTLKTA